jgi:DNA-directed RNA polymerase specialized sigma24 family protein
MSDITSLPSPDDPAQAFAVVVALRMMADKLERETVVSAVKQGWSWTDIADALGVSRQAAHKRLAGHVHLSTSSDPSSPSE